MLCVLLAFAVAGEAGGPFRAEIGHAPDLQIRHIAEGHVDEGVLHEGARVMLREEVPYDDGQTEWDEDLISKFEHVVVPNYLGPDSYPLNDENWLRGNHLVTLQLELEEDGCAQLHWNTTLVLYLCGDAGDAGESSVAAPLGTHTVRSTVSTFDGRILSGPARLIHLHSDGPNYFEGITVVGKDGLVPNALRKQRPKAAVHDALDALRRFSEAKIMSEALDPASYSASCMQTAERYMPCGADSYPFFRIVSPQGDVEASDSYLEISVLIEREVYGLWGLPVIVLAEIIPSEMHARVRYHDLTSIASVCGEMVDRACHASTKIQEVMYPRSFMLIIEWFNITCFELPSGYRAGGSMSGCSLHNLGSFDDLPRNRLVSRNTTVFRYLEPEDTKLAQCWWAIDDPRKKPDSLRTTTDHLQGCTSCFQNGSYAAARSGWVARRANPISVGTAVLLLADDELIYSRRNVVRVPGEPQIGNGGNPVFEASEPWERRQKIAHPTIPQRDDDLVAKLYGPAALDIKTVSFYGTVLYERGIFRMWYRVLFRNVLCYAESEDAIHWNKPNLNTDGSNVVLWTESGSIYLDEHESDPRHRYKIALGTNTTEATIAHSADGLTWTPYTADFAPVTHRASDTYNTIRWLPDANTYMLVTRTDFATYSGWREIRGIRFMTNPNPKEDPKGWTSVAEWYLDQQGKGERCRRQLYSFTFMRHHDIFVAFVTVLEHPRDLHEGRSRSGETPLDNTTRHEFDVLNVYLSTSRDALHWDLSFIYTAQPFLIRGPQASWYKDGIDPSSNFVTVGDEHYIFFSGRPERHQFTWQYEEKIGFATVRTDRFVALAHEPQLKNLKSEDWGVIETHVLLIEHGRLLINIDANRPAHPQGTLQVEVVLVSDSSEEVADSFSRHDSTVPLGADSTKLEVGWGAVQHGLDKLVGHSVRLRFYLQHARLYAFQFSE